MEKEGQQDREVGRIRRMLHELGRLAEHASLTGSFAKAGITCVQQYNRLLSRLEQKGHVTTGWFDLLPEDASMADVGVSARLLSAYLEDQEDDERSRNVIVGLGDISKVGEMVREHLPDWLRHREERHAERDARHAEREARRAQRHAEREMRHSGHAGHPFEASGDEASARRDEAQARLDEARARLDEERARLDEERARLDEERARLEERAQ
jgi:NAD-dependent DNA ligase